MHNTGGAHNTAKVEKKVTISIKNDKEVSGEKTATLNSDRINPLIEELKKDGLVKGDDIRIDILNGELYLNDVKQSDEVTYKYRHLF